MYIVRAEVGGKRKQRCNKRWRPMLRERGRMLGRGEGRGVFTHDDLFQLTLSRQTANSKQKHGTEHQSNSRHERTVAPSRRLESIRNETPKLNNY